MRSSSKINDAVLFALAFLVLPCCVHANIETGVEVKNAQVELVGEEYLISANIHYDLGKNAIEALNNGVSLYWTYLFKVKEQRHYLWDETLVEKKFRYRIQYHALLKMFRVSNENNGAVENFSSLQAALDLLSTLRDYRLIEKAKLDSGKNYTVGIKINFEQDALPLPLRPMAYLNPDWYLSSEWYLWPLKN